MPGHHVEKFQGDDFHAVDSKTKVANAGKREKVQKGHRQSSFHRRRELDVM